jgi:hypothetical protein
MRSIFASLESFQKSFLQLTTLRLSSMDIGCVEVVLLTEALHSNKYLLSLEVSNTCIGNYGMTAIDEALYSSNLEYLTQLH